MTKHRATTASIFIPLLVAFAAGQSCLAAPNFAPGLQTGNIQNYSISEASGLVASHMNPNVLWTHNDSGNSARLYAMTSAGTDLGTYSISGATNFDWEEIAIGEGPVAGTQYLYIGDIGDNFAIRSTFSVYRLPEPAVSDTQAAVSSAISGVSKFTFSYPDGPRDAESMFVDPLTKDLYIISKRENPKHVYRAPYPQSTSGTTMLQLMTTFVTDSTWLTAADISPDGNEIIVRSTDTSSGRLFVRPPGGSVTDAFNSVPITIPLHSEAQGEAITFDPNGRGYFTTSEGSNPPIYYFDRLPPPPGASYWDGDGAVAGNRLVTGTAIGGSGTWDTATPKWYNGSADVRWTSGNDAVFWGAAGTVVLAANQTANSLLFKTSGYVLTASTLTLGGPTITVDSGVSATIDSALAGSAGLVKNGGGTLNLSNGNGYIGTTTINSGTIQVTNASGSATGAGTVAVNVGAVLRGTGTIQGDLTNSGTVAPGMSIGTLHLDGNYAQTNDAVLEIEFASPAEGDQLAVAGIASLAGALAVSLTGGYTPAAGNAFEIITASELGSSTFTNATLPALPDNLQWHIEYGVSSVTLSVGIAGDFNLDGTVDAADSVVWRQGLGTTYTQFDYDIWRAHYGQSAASGSGQASLAAVPEPNRLLVCLAGMIAKFTRRRTEAF